MHQVDFNSSSFIISPFVPLNALCFISDKGALLKQCFTSFIFEIKKSISDVVSSVDQTDFVHLPLAFDITPHHMAFFSGYFKIKGITGVSHRASQ